MSAGTLTLTNNSAAVAGSGTAFTTEVAAGDFIVVTVGGVPYTLPVKSVESGAALTLVSNFTGPTQSGAAWSAVPRVALNMVTAALVAQSAEALRGLNYDKQNWQLLFSANGNITVRLPDTSEFTGPSWKSIIEQVNNALLKSQALADLPDKNAARDNLTLGNSQDVTFGSVLGTRGVNSVAGGSGTGVKSTAGVKKDILLTSNNVDGEQGWMMNQLQGWMGNSFYQFGGIRGAGNYLDAVALITSSFGSGAATYRFNFLSGYGGVVQSPRGFWGSCQQGGWGDVDGPWTTPYWSSIIGGNDGGWAPIVSGGSSSTGGYSTRLSLGIIATGANSWPHGVLHFMGDARFHRMFRFNPQSGDITTDVWNESGSNWQGSYVFAKNATSDRDLKEDIQYRDGKDSFDRVMQWLPTMFKYKGSDTQRFGLIAQDLTKVDPQYVKIVPGGPVFEDVIGVDESGNEYVDHQIEVGLKDDTLALDNNVIMADMACAMVYMGRAMKVQMSELNSLKNVIETLKGSLQN
ncbi:tail fiber domain-containing protein [Citrobacter freundii]|nr:tail fiber domain-containing protein [Citrobacter freundii]